MALHSKLLNLHRCNLSRSSQLAMRLTIGQHLQHPTALCLQFASHVLVRCRVAEHFVRDRSTRTAYHVKPNRCFAIAFERNSISQVCRSTQPCIAVLNMWRGSEAVTTIDTSIFADRVRGSDYDGVRKLLTPCNSSHHVMLKWLLEPEISSVLNLKLTKHGHPHSSHPLPRN